MIHYIQKAAENFVTHQLELSHQHAAPDTQMRTFIAYIDCKSMGGTMQRVYLGCDHHLMQAISEVYFFEESDDNGLQELLLEVANMVIGSAKVIAEEEDIEPFTITTPFFEKIGTFDMPHDASAALKVDGHIMNIAIKEL